MRNDLTIPAGIVKLSLAALQILVDRYGNGRGCQGMNFHWICVLG